MLTESIIAIVIASLALIVAIIGLVLGGVALSKAKKSRRGPRGPQGLQGPKGDNCQCPTPYTETSIDVQSLPVAPEITVPVNTGMTVESRFNKVTGTLPNFDEMDFLGDGGEINKGDAELQFLNGNNPLSSVARSPVKMTLHPVNKRTVTPVNRSTPNKSVRFG